MPKKPLQPPGNNRQVINLPSRLQEIGKIKMGGRDQSKPKKAKSGETYYLPKKHDYFMLMSTKKDSEGFFIPDDDLLNMMGCTSKRINGIWATVPPLTEFDIYFPYNDPHLIFRSFYAFYAGKEIRCRGDGLKAERINSDTDERSIVDCPCKQYTDENAKRKCKLNGILQCIPAVLPSTSGIYTLRTTGFHTTTALQTTINGYYKMTGGMLFGIKFKLRLSMQQCTIKLPDGSNTVATFPVALIDYSGRPDKLIDEAFKNKSKLLPLQTNRMIELERQLLTEPIPEESDKEIKEISDEYYPENINKNGDNGNESGKQENEGKEQTSLL